MTFSIRHIDHDDWNNNIAPVVFTLERLLAEPWSWVAEHLPAQHIPAPEAPSLLSTTAVMEVFPRWPM